MEAMKMLNGHPLPSSERGGIRIEFAKNKMGEVSVDKVSIHGNVIFAMVAMVTFIPGIKIILPIFSSYIVLRYLINYFSVAKN